MRIALLTREYPPETSWGGIGTFYSQFAESLSARGHDVEVVTQGLSTPDTNIQNGVLVHRVVPRQWIVGARRGGPLAGMPSRCLGIFAASLGLEVFRTVLTRHRRKPFEIVEGHEHLGINALVNAWAPDDVVTITRYHTAYHTLVSRRLENWPASTVIKRMERASIHRAHVRVAASEFVKRIAAEDFPGAPSCECVIPMFPCWREQATPVPFAQRAKLIIVVGRLSSVKRADLAGQIFAAISERFPGWRLEFAGMDTESSPGVSVWQQCQAALAGLEGRYAYHGVLDRAALNALFSRSRISLFPSAFESFGLAAVEAMAAGSVPVVSDETALPEVVADAGLICRKGEPADFIAKLSELMADEERQERLSHVAAQRAGRVFSEDCILSANIDFFRRLLDSRKERRARV